MLRHIFQQFDWFFVFVLLAEIDSRELQFFQWKGNKKLIRLLETET